MKYDSHVRESTHQESVTRPSLTCTTVVPQRILAVSTRASKEDPLDILLIDQDSKDIGIRDLYNNIQIGC